jgi:hypothetical protein
VVLSPDTRCYPPVPLTGPSSPLPARVEAAGRQWVDPEDILATEGAGLRCACSVKAVDHPVGGCRREPTHICSRCGRGVCGNCHAQDQCMECYDPDA